MNVTVTETTVILRHADCATCDYHVTLFEGEQVPWACPTCDHDKEVPVSLRDKISRLHGSEPRRRMELYDCTNCGHANGKHVTGVCTAEDEDDGGDEGETCGCTKLEGP